MTRYSVLTYTVLFAAIVLIAFSLTDDAADRTATMAPDLHFQR